MYNDIKGMPVDAMNIPKGMDICEESMQSIMDDILNMTKHCNRMSYSIKEGLFGSTSVAGQTEKPIACFMDAMKETRNTLKETIDELESISRRL